MKSKSSNLKVILLSLLVMALWGSLFPCIKLGYKAFAIESSDIPSILMFAGTRFTICGVIICAIALIKKDKIADINLDDLRYMFELNCVSAVGMIQEIYPIMAERKCGLFVNILTSCCLFNNPMTGSYSATKDAMEGISKILTKEARADHIGVCNVYPGGVDTNFRAASNPNYLKPETVAKMIKNCMEVEEGCVHDIVFRPFIENNLP